MRVVDDLAGQKDTAVGKTLAGLIGIVDGAVDAIAEPELAREMDRETAGPISKIVYLNLLNEIAVVVLIQLCCDRIFQVEALRNTSDEVMLSPGPLPRHAARCGSRLPRAAAAHSRRSSLRGSRAGRHDIDRAQIGAHFAHARADEGLVDVDEDWSSAAA